MRTDLPAKVFASIQSHLRKGSLRGEQGWESGSEEEDTLTGDFCGSLRTEGWLNVSDGSGGSWRYRVTYKKFRGRGKGAEEKIFGTDGIVEVQIENLSNGIKFGKGLLFQAKKRGASGRKKLRSQAQAMEKICSGGSAIFEYGPRKYIGVDSSKVLTDPSVLASTDSSTRLGDYLADRFLPCDAGKRGIYYDAVARAIVYPDDQGNIIRAHATVKHRLRIEVVSEK